MNNARHLTTVYLKDHVRREISPRYGLNIWSVKNQNYYFDAAPPTVERFDIHDLRLR